MSTYAVKTFKAKKAKKAADDLSDFLNELAGEGWDVVSVLPGLDVKGAGLVGNRPDSFLIVVSRAGA